MAEEIWTIKARFYSLRVKTMIIEKASFIDLENVWVIWVYND
jgi:hypothetical protein